MRRKFARRWCGSRRPMHAMLSILDLLLANRFPRIWIPSPGGAGSAAATATSPQDGLLTNFGKKPVTCARHGPGGLSKKKVVGSRRTDRTGSTEAGSGASRRRKDLLDILDRLDPSLGELDRAVAKEA